jgi:hypothetical protein
MKTNKPNETGVCSICGAPYSHFGNNPEPVKNFDERCCDKCNWEIVIPMRMDEPPGCLGSWETQVVYQDALRKQQLEGI